METPMFHNVGKEIKHYARVIWRLVIAIFVILSILLLISGFAVLRSMPLVGLLLILGSIAVFTIGYFLARLSAMLLYAYGEITERVTSIDEKLVKKSGSPPLPVAHPNPPTPKRKVTGPTPPTVDLNISSDGSWDCPFCGHKNPASADGCESCGIIPEFGLSSQSGLLPES